jgi:hypothetical protein
MKILLISDTHGRDEGVEEVLEKEKNMQYLIHCGDVEGREDYIAALADCPCSFISGNNDYYCDLPREIVLNLAGQRIFVTHGHTYYVSHGLHTMLQAAQQRKCGIVMYGHTHTPSVETYGGVLFMNPGSLTFPRQSDHRPSYIVIEAQPDQPWQPQIRFLDRKKRSFRLF